MFPSMGILNVIFQSVPFCFGPASIALAIANEFSKYRNQVHMNLVAFGEGTSLELFSASGIFDEVIHFEVSSKEAFSVIRLLQKADVIISVVDFDFAMWMKSFNKKVYFVDPLYWMWNKDPMPMTYCERYYVLDFPGVEKRMEDHKNRCPNDLPPILVPPVCLDINLNKTDSLRKEGELVVNFGGIQSPLGTNLPLVEVMSNLIIDAANDLPELDRIYICGGGTPTKHIARSLKPSNKRIRIGPLGQTEFINKLASSRHFMTVPGLSIIYEAISLHKETLILLPINYSQHMQGRIYRNILRGADYVLWDDLPGYDMLPEGLPEETGVNLALRLGHDFYKDSNAQGIFMEKVRRFLNRKAGEPLKLGKWKTRDGEVAFIGATQIVVDIFSQIAAG